jgi:hypothetical protein
MAKAYDQPYEEAVRTEILDAHERVHYVKKLTELMSGQTVRPPRQTRAFKECAELRNFGLKNGFPLPPADSMNTAASKGQNQAIAEHRHRIKTRATDLEETRQLHQTKDAGLGR